MGSGQQCVTTNGVLAVVPRRSPTPRSRRGSYIDALVFQTVPGAAGETFYVDGLSVSEPGSPSVPALPEVQGDPVLLGLGRHRLLLVRRRRGHRAPPRHHARRDRHRRRHGAEPRRARRVPGLLRAHPGAVTSGAPSRRWATTSTAPPGAAGYFSYFGSAAGQTRQGLVQLRPRQLAHRRAEQQLRPDRRLRPRLRAVRVARSRTWRRTPAAAWAPTGTTRAGAPAPHTARSRSRPPSGSCSTSTAPSSSTAATTTPTSASRRRPPTGRWTTRAACGSSWSATGGTQHYPLNAPLANTQVQTPAPSASSSSHSTPTATSGSFLPQAGRTFTDTGSTNCSPLTNDTQAPETTIDSGPPASWPPRSASIVVLGATRPASTFECKLDAGAWQACTSPRALTGLAEGDAHLPRARHRRGRQHRPDRGHAHVDRRHRRARHDDRLRAERADRLHRPRASRSPPPRPARRSSASSTPAPGRPAPRRARSPGSPTAPTPSACAPPTPPATPTPTEATRTWTVDTRRARHHDRLRARPARRRRRRRASRSRPPRPARRSSASSTPAPGRRCTSPRALTGLAEGAHTFRVRATDAAGNTDADRGHAHLDRRHASRPTPRSAPGRAGTDAPRSATLGFSSRETGATFECKLDAGAWQPLHLAARAQRPRRTARTPSACAPSTRPATPTPPRPRAPGPSTPSRPTRRSPPGPSGPIASASAQPRVHLRPRPARRSSASSTAARWQTLHLAARAHRRSRDGAHTFRVRATDAAGNTDADARPRAPGPSTRSRPTPRSAPARAARPRRRRPTLRASLRRTPARRSSASSTTAPGRPAPRRARSPASPQGAHTLPRARHRRGRQHRRQRGHPHLDRRHRGARHDDRSRARRADRAHDRDASRSPRPTPRPTFECKLDDGGLAALRLAARRSRALADGATPSGCARPTPPATPTPPRPTRTWTVDTQAPDTTLRGGPSGSRRRYDRGRLHLRARARPASTFECKLDDGAWQACTSPRTLTGLGDGQPHVPRPGARRRRQRRRQRGHAHLDGRHGRARDHDRLRAPPDRPRRTSATFAFSLDRARLELPVQARRRRLADLRVAAHAHGTRPRASTACACARWTPPGTWTPARRPHLDRGHRGAGHHDRLGTRGHDGVQPRRVHVRLGRGRRRPSSAGSSDGGWQDPCVAPDVLTGLANGEHDLHVRARDAAGNLDSSPAGHTWTVDAEPPDTTITGGPAGTVRTTGAHLHLRRRASPATGFECRLDGGAWQSVHVPAQPHRPRARPPHASRCARWTRSATRTPHEASALLDDRACPAGGQAARGRTRRCNPPAGGALHEADHGPAGHATSPRARGRSRRARGPQAAQAARAHLPALRPLLPGTFSPS